MISDTASLYATIEHLESALGEMADNSTDRSAQMIVMALAALRLELRLTTQILVQVLSRQT